MAISKYRRPKGVLYFVSLILPAASLVLAVLYLFHQRPFGFVLMDRSYLFLLLAAFLPQCFIWMSIRPGVSKANIPWYDKVLAALGFVSPIYFVYTQNEIMRQGWATGAPPVPFVFSIILWVVLIEAGRRSAGPFFAFVLLFFSLYPLFASHMPGFLWAPSWSVNRVASYYAISDQGVIGLIMRVYGNLVFGYMFFSIVLQVLGAGRFFNDFAVRLLKNSKAGNAKVAIVTSGLFGSVSGASIANVMTTGSFTIPAMKREGFPDYFAAAVEACASSGGLLMPPIMGTVAFIMSEFLEVPYAEVCIVAAVPAILYFVCLFAQIDAYARRKDIRPVQINDDVPPVWRTLLNNLHIILAFVVLLLLLFFLRLDSQGPWIATAVAIGVALLRKETRPNYKHLVQLLEEAARVLGELVGILAPIGMLLASLIIADVAYSLPHEIVGLAGGNQALLLLFGAFAAFILGTGLTLSAVYIFLAIVLAPGLVKAGFDIMASHLFVLYCGMMSEITPPVALAAFAAASIAGSSPMRTGIQAVKLGVAKYILPFIFILNPSLILRGEASEALRMIPAALIGLIIMSGALEGYLWGIGKLTIASQALFFGAAILMVAPTLTTDLYGIGLFIFVFFLSYVNRGKDNRLARLLLNQR